MAVDPYQAARVGDLAGLRSYAENGGIVDIIMPGQLQRTPLHVAIESAQIGAARLLIELGANVGAGDYRAQRPLHYAAGMGLLSVVELILDRGAEPGALDVFGETALHRVASGGGKAPEGDQVRIARRLLASGIPPDAVGNAGRTPLWYAAVRGKVALAVALLEAGADPGRRAAGELGTPADVAIEGVVELLRRPK